jgi:ElaB/YqjD/DUF883 family membrane-anchored ribosome-binding protein
VSEQQQQRTPEEIRSEIEETREDLADTAAALAYKADVKARAHDRVEEVKADLRVRMGGIKSTVSEKTPDTPGEAVTSARTTVEQNPVQTAAVAAALLGFTLGFLIAKRRA